MHLYAEPVEQADLVRAADADRLIAVVDACGEASVPERAAAVGPTRARSLWSGRPYEDLWAIAPYAFRVDRSILDWIHSSLGPTPWGIFFRAASKKPFQHLTLHLERFVEATVDGLRHYHFRFYDPRVVEPYLQTCDPVELAAFYGPFEAIGVSDFTTGGTCWWRTLGGIVSQSGRVKDLKIRVGQ